VYQLGRGNDPVIVVGSIFPAVAFNISASPSLRCGSEQPSNSTMAAITRSTNPLLIFDFGFWIR
jgi:hypothetical protein